MLEAQVIVDAGELTSVEPHWDELAVANAQPTMSPAWGLAWWRHLAPQPAELRVIVVRDGAAVLGIAPFVAQRRGGCVFYELLPADTGRNSPLAMPGREWDVAEAAWGALASTQPRPDVVRFPSAPLSAWYGPWHAALRSRDGRWPIPIVRHFDPIPCPVMTLDGTFDDWLQGRSANFRSEMRRLRRRFAQAGATIRMSGPDTVHDDLRTYLRLHLARWEGRGSGYERVGDRLRIALEETAAALPPDRFRLYVSELDGAPIAAQLFLAAGGEIMYHNGGWDERHSRLKPGMIGILHAAEEGFAYGDRRLDFGPVAYDYKLRFTSENDPIAGTSIVTPSRRVALAAAARAQRAVSRRGREILSRRYRPTPTQ